MNSRAAQMRHNSLWSPEVLLRVRLTAIVVTLVTRSGHASCCSDEIALMRPYPVTRGVELHLRVFSPRDELSNTLKGQDTVIRNIEQQMRGADI
jgi:hypothetical protein